jgi:hypothetical protein
MKIAIHNRPGSFSDIWLKYCKTNRISYKIVNCYDADIVNQLEDCNGLMWHWPQWDAKAVLFARQLTYSLEKAGKSVFPDSNTCWHFDDKVGQKYLFEALKIETIPTWIFYDKKTAINWIQNAQFPLVFKLRGGASSENVKLLKSKAEARKKVTQAFGEGFKTYDKWYKLRDRILKFQRNKTTGNFISIIKGIGWLVLKNGNELQLVREKGYVYFQKFLPGNDSDIRLVVVGSRCFGMRRYCRKDDFRASGSGVSTYDHEKIEPEAVKVAFEIAQLLKMQSAAFDFIKENGQFKLVEVSYAFVSNSFPGYWDVNLNWIEGDTSPQEFIISEFIKTL